MVDNNRFDIKTDRITPPCIQRKAAKGKRLPLNCCAIRMFPSIYVSRLHIENAHVSFYLLFVWPSPVRKFCWWVIVWKKEVAPFVDSVAIPTDAENVRALSSDLTLTASTFPDLIFFTCWFWDFVKCYLHQQMATSTIITPRDVRKWTTKRKCIVICVKVFVQFFWNLCSGCLCAASHFKWLPFRCSDRLEQMKKCEYFMILCAPSDWRYWPTLALKLALLLLSYTLVRWKLMQQKTKKEHLWKK